MDIERKGLLSFSGKDVTIVGPDLKVGQKAAEFWAQNTNWETIPALGSTKGKVRIIGSLLSLSTSVCDRETRRFNEEAINLGEDVRVLILSMDLPFTQKDWCGSAGIDKVITLSDHLEADFGKKYGLLIKEFRFLRRAIFVIDRNDQLVYVDYMAELGNEPNYPEVIQAAKKALSN